MQHTVRHRQAGKAALLRLLPAIAALLALAPAHPAQATVAFTDGTFDPANYASTPVYRTGIPPAAISQCQTCGNPGQAVQITLTVPASGGAYARGAINTTFSYDPAVQGPITAIAASVDKDVTSTFVVNNFANTFRPVIEQGGNDYLATITGAPITFPAGGGATGYLTISQSGLTASDFTLFDFTTGTFGAGNPDFAAGPILFGLAQISSFGSGPGGTYTIDYDNLDITVSGPTASVPEPTSLALLGTVLLGLRSARRWRPKRPS